MTVFEPSAPLPNRDAAEACAHPRIVRAVSPAGSALCPDCQEWVRGPAVQAEDRDADLHADCHPCSEFVALEDDYASATARANTAEAENADLRDRLARVEGLEIEIREVLNEPTHVRIVRHGRVIVDGYVGAALSTPAECLCGYDHFPVAADDETSA